MVDQGDQSGGGRVNWTEHTSDVDVGESGEDDETDDADDADAVGDFSKLYSACWRPSVRLTYNPAQTKIPVKTPFCEAVVRSRQSRGIGYTVVNIAREIEPFHIQA